MPRRRSTSRRRAEDFDLGNKWVHVALALFLSAGHPVRAWAQACCAGGSAVTPGRLKPYEDALVGIQMRVAGVLGSYDVSGRYLASPAGDTEADLEQDLLGALRVLPRGQVAVLIPLVETSRATPLDGSHFGGGIGDMNLSARYDFALAGERHYFPGLALLAGVTMPTGRPVESATSRLAVDATGIGAFQGQFGLALEQTFGPWLVNATGTVAARGSRFGETLGTQITVLAAGAYTFTNDAALALAVSYAFEGDARTTSGTPVPSSSKRVTTATISILWPLGNGWRLLGGVLLNPPIENLGSNQPTTGGFTFTVIRSWS
ncbi:MAG TPA: hypothetical protein VGY54_23715 [Polyangiaceae bacterium]|jgi:hypothetical protein|nr:hypothetical protein [Polyangiaceae bacterium]